MSKDFDPELDGYPCYEKIGSFISSPRFVIYLDKEPNKKYGSNNFDLQAHANDVAHYLMMRNNLNSMSDAISDCIIKQPNVVIIDMKKNKEYTGHYIVLH